MSVGGTSLEENMRSYQEFADMMSSPLSEEEQLRWFKEWVSKPVKHPPQTLDAGVYKAANSALFSNLPLL